MTVVDPRVPAEVERRVAAPELPASRANPTRRRARGRLGRSLDGGGALRRSSGVTVLYWPAEEEEVRRLADLGAARLLLLEAGAQPPDDDDCLQDWLRLPAADADISNRIRALARRRERHASLPRVDDSGRLFHRGFWVSLSPIEQRLASVLVEHVGEVVTDGELLCAGWPGEVPSPGALRVHLTRLRKRVAPLGLTLRGVRSRGQVLEEASPSET